MISYRYEALDSRGDRHEGLRVARDEDTLSRHLQEQGLTPLTVEKQQRFRLRPLRHRKRLARFFRNLELFLDSGMELVPALRQVADRVDDDRIRACVETVVHDLEAGRSLGDSMASCEPFFPREAHRLCAVGEQTGELTTACEQLASFYRTQYEFGDRVYNLLLYPMIVLTVGVLVVAFLFVYVLPRLSMLFQQQGADLPWMTRMLFGTAQFFRGWGLVVMPVAVAGVGWGVWWGLQTPRGQHIKARVLLWSTVYRRIQGQLFCLAMAMATRVGLNISRALELGRDVLDNPILQERVEAVIQSVKSGQTLTDGLRGAGFDMLPLDSLAAGEKSGHLDRVFQFQARLLSEEAEESLTRLMTVFEPAMVLVLTLFVGFVLAAVMLPIVDMATAF